MALLVIEGCDHYTNLSVAQINSMLTSKWGVGTYAIDALVDARNGKGIRMQAASNQLRYNVNSATATVGCAIKFDSSIAQRIMLWSGDTGATHHFTLELGSSGELKVYRGNTATLLGSSATGLIATGVWYYIEASVTLHDSAGTVKVSLNGTEVINLTGQDTKNGGTAAVFDRVGFFTNASVIQTLDDLYIRNDLTQHGDVRVETIMPSGNGTTSGLTGSDGNSVDNYALVDETAIDDADYVGSATPGTKDTYALADLQTTLVDVIAVQVTNRAAKSDAGAISGRRVVRSGGTDYAGADLLLSTSFAYYRELLATDPATATDWTPSGVNALEAGWEVRA